MIQAFLSCAIPEQQKLQALYDICLRTSEGGRGGEGLYRDPKLLGNIFAVPYALFEPQYTLLWIHDGEISGYCVGVPDSVRFHQKLVGEWFPSLGVLEGERDKVFLERYIAAGLPGFCAAYSAHLHINLLPECRGIGAGRKLMEAQLCLLSATATGVYLGTNPNNTKAIGFYRKLGFLPLVSTLESSLQPDCCWLGMKF